MPEQFEAGIANLSLPENIKPGDEKYYEMSLSGPIRPCEVKMYEWVWANWELILWRNNEMLEEAFAWPWLKKHLYGGWKPRLKFEIKKLLRPAQQVKGRVLWCLDGYATGGYYHWIVDVLPRLWMVRSLLPSVQFAVPDYFLSQWPFVQEYFDLLGITQLLVLTNYRKYLLQHLILPTRAGNPFFSQPIPIREGVKWLMEAALAKSQRQLGNRLFISRKKARYRKIANEEELLPVLEKFGFEVVCLEDYPLADQISICNNASTILGLHGAGLTNSVFMKPGSRLIEIRPEKVYGMYNCFFTLCPLFEIRYNYILCQYAPEKLPTERRIDDHSVVLSAEALAKELTAIFSWGNKSTV